MRPTRCDIRKAYKPTRFGRVSRSIFQTLTHFNMSFPTPRTSPFTDRLFLNPLTTVVPTYAIRSHNSHGHRLGRATAEPYPTTTNVYVRSAHPNGAEDSFEDLFLNDFVIAHKRVARRKLEAIEMCQAHRHFLERGSNHQLEKSEPYNGILDTALGYAAAGTTMVYDIAVDVNDKVNTPSTVPVLG